MGLMMVEVTQGQHTGKIRYLIGMFQGANVALVKTIDGKEIAVEPMEVSSTKR